MDGRCEGCRFWRAPPSRVEIAGVEWRHCDRAGEWSFSYSAPPSGRMIVVAIDDEAGGLWTAPDFGCVEWQAISATSST